MSNTTEQSPVGSEAEGFSGDRDKARREQRMLGQEKKCRSRYIVPRDANGARMVAGLEREALRQGPGNM